MDGNPVEKVISELFPYFEALESRSAAILQLLKDKGLTTDEQFASYLEQAGNASNVKWLAAKVRIERLLSSAVKDKDMRKIEGEKAESPAEERAAEISTEQNTAEISTEQNTENSAAKSAESDTGTTSETNAEKTTQKAIDGDTGKADKETVRKVAGDDIKESSDKNSKGASARSGEKSVLGKSAQKKTK
ncbi:MAG: hypothetical protein ACRD2S_03710 [Terriglobales bacterium]